MATLRIMSSRKLNAVESYRGEIHQRIWLLQKETSPQVLTVPHLMQMTVRRVEQNPPKLDKTFQKWLGSHLILFRTIKVSHA